MDFKIRISSISEFDDLLSHICEKGNIQQPNHVEIDSDDSDFINVRISDDFVAHLNETDLQKLKDIK